MPLGESGWRPWWQCPRCEGDRTGANGIPCRCPGRAMVPSLSAGPVAIQPREEYRPRRTMVLGPVERRRR